MEGLRTVPLTDPQPVGSHTWAHVLSVHSTHEAADCNCVVPFCPSSPQPQEASAAALSEPPGGCRGPDAVRLHLEKLNLDFEAAGCVSRVQSPGAAAGGLPSSWLCPLHRPTAPLL